MGSGRNGVKAILSLYTSYQEALFGLIRPGLYLLLAKNHDVSRRSHNLGAGQSLAAGLFTPEVMFPRTKPGWR